MRRQFLLRPQDAERDAGRVHLRGDPAVRHVLGGLSQSGARGDLDCPHEVAAGGTLTSTVETTTKSAHLARVYLGKG
jgi:hypothetical protein